MPLYEEKTWDTVVFYCKDCEKIVPTDRAGKKYVYVCKMCGTKNVAFGTLKSIQNYFHVEDEAPPTPPASVPPSAPSAAPSARS
jgi:hypothetical protein